MVSYINELRHVYLFLEQIMCSPRGVLLGILGGGVPPGSPNPDPISDQKKKNVIFHTRFQTGPLKSTPVFRPGL